MPKRKDSFICKWVSGSGRLIRERLILYKDSSSSENDNSENVPFIQHKPHHRHEERESLEIVNHDRKLLIRAFMTVIYVCMEELVVLKRFCKRTADPAWNEPLVYKNLEHLYNLGEAYDMHKLDDMRKSLRDICVLFNILSNTFIELQKEGKFTILEKSTDILNQQIQDEIQLIDDLKFMQKYKEYLRLTTIREESERKTRFLNICEEVNHSKLVFEDVLGFARDQYCYNDDWETARLEQSLWLGFKETQALEDLITKCKEDTVNEKRIHSEVENYCTEYVQELTQQINEWQSKYETELEEDESQLIYLTNEMEMITLKHAKLQEVYEKRCKEMAEWIEYRTKKEIADEYERKRLNAARKIQAWWRRLMFIRKLGPYSKKKKGKKGAKNTKKK